MRQFAVLNIVDYNDKRVTFTLLHCYPFVLLVCCFDVHIYITRSKHGIDSDLEGPAKKTRGPEDLEGPRNLLLISTLTPDHIDTICSGYVERHCMTQRLPATTTCHRPLTGSGKNSHELQQRERWSVLEASVNDALTAAGDAVWRHWWVLTICRTRSSWTFQCRLQQVEIVLHFVQQCQSVHSIFTTSVLHTQPLNMQRQTPEAEACDKAVDYVNSYRLFWFRQV